MAKKNLAQNDTIELELDSARNSAVGIASSDSASATAVFILEGKMEDSDACPWIAITTKNPSAAPVAEQANITGPSKAGWADMPAFARARVRRTDVTGGDGTAFITSGIS